MFRRRFASPLVYSTVTRLLVELNRSLGHRELFSEYSRKLSDRAKQRVLQRHYHPYRDRVESWILQQMESSFHVVHLSLHTFTPRLNGNTRNADIGLLYDPRRDKERAFCDDWYLALKACRPDLCIRRNYPYLGKADGFTTYLRRRFLSGYTSIELEVNQAWLGRLTADWRRLQLDLTSSFATAWKRHD